MHVRIMQFASTTQTSPANLGKRNPILSLFHNDLDLPIWLFDTISE